MNDSHDEQERQKRLAEAAANFTPACPPKYEALMPFRESIATLRRKGASYRAITDILHTVRVSVSLDTVARFCREMVEQRQPRKTRRRPVVRPPLPSASDAPSGPSPAALPNGAGTAHASDAAPVSEPPAKSKGPRIADPRNV